MIHSVTEKFFVLLVPYSIVKKDPALTVNNQQAAHADTDHIVFIGRVLFLPEAFGHDSEHRSPVEFHVSAGNCVNLHFFD